MNDIGRRIKELRKAYGMTQAKLAELSGISVNSIRLYESGKIVPKNKTLEIIAACFQMNLGEFLYYEHIQKWEDGRSYIVNAGLRELSTPERVLLVFPMLDENEIIAVSAVIDSFLNKKI